MAQIEVPKNLYHLTTRKLVLNKKEIDKVPPNLFLDEKNDFTLFLDGSGQYWLFPENYFFRTINIKGGVIINCKNIKRFACSIDNSWTPTSGTILDNFPGKKLKINNPDGMLDFGFSIFNNKSSLESLSLLAKKYYVNIENQQSLKKLKIDHSNKSINDSQVKLVNLQHLESLDLQGWKNIELNHCLHLSVINPDCVIKFDPDTKIVNNTMSYINKKTNKDEYLIFWNDLNSIFSLPLQTKATQAQFNGELKLSDVLDVKDLSKPIEIKYGDLRKKIDKYCIKMVEQKHQLVR